MTVKRRRKTLELWGSAKVAKMVPEATRVQIVLRQMDEDPADHHGVKTVTSKIKQDQNIHIGRYVHLSISTSVHE